MHILKTNSPGALRDFTSIVRSSALNKGIRVFQSKTFESDLMNLKLNKKSWEVTWEKGQLTNDEGKPLLYFHFLLSKDVDTFQFSKYLPGIEEFRINSSGIKG